MTVGSFIWKHQNKIGNKSGHGNRLMVLIVSLNVKLFQ